MELPLEEFYYGHPPQSQQGQGQGLEGLMPMPYSMDMQLVPSQGAAPQFQDGPFQGPPSSAAYQSQDLAFNGPGAPVAYLPQEVAFLEAMPLAANPMDAAHWVHLWNEAKGQETAKLRDQFLLAQGGISAPCVGQDWNAIMMQLRSVDDDVARQSTQLNAIYEANRQDPEAYAVCAGLANALLRWRIINASLVAAQRAGREIMAQSETFKAFLPVYDTAVLAMTGPIRMALRPTHGIGSGALLLGSFVGGLFPSLIEAAVTQYRPQKKMTPAKSLQVINGFDRFRPAPLL